MSPKKGLDTKTDGLNGRQSCKTSTSPSKGSNEHSQSDQWKRVRKQAERRRWMASIAASYLGVPNSNLGPETGYTKVFLVFFSPTGQIPGQNLKFDHELYNLCCWQEVTESPRSRIRIKKKNSNKFSPPEIFIS
jgi:hypothetical protein